MKITVISKPEKKTSQKGNSYYTFKAKDESGIEKSGNYFGTDEPLINTEYEVEEKYNEQYNNYTWFPAKKKPAFAPRMSIEQSLRVEALRAGMQTGKHGNELIKATEVFYTYLNTGKWTL